MHLLALGVWLLSRLYWILYWAVLSVTSSGSPRFHSFAGSTGRSPWRSLGRGSGFQYCPHCWPGQTSLCKTNIWPTGLGVSVFNVFTDPAHPEFTRTTAMTCVWPEFPGNVHDTVDESQPRLSYDRNITTAIRSAATPPPLDIRKGSKRRGVQASSCGGETLRGWEPLRKHLSGWLLFVGIELGLNVLKIHSTNSCVFSP